MSKEHFLQRTLCVAGALLYLVTAHAETANVQFDNNGNVIQRTTPLGSTIYTYDALNRLQTETGPAKTQTFSFDADGNRLSDGTGSYTYSATANRQATRLGAAVSYDPAGNITADGSGRTFTYNQAGRLYQVFKSGVLYASYYYNYQGQRTRKATTASAPQGAQTLLYQYDPQGHLMAEFTGAGAPIRSYVWRDDTPIAQIDYQPSRRILYFETDHLNTPRAAMDATGKVAWRWESDAFGTTLANEDPSGSGVKTTVNLRFPGQYYDQETGLSYNYFRDYDSGVGRYIESDPIGLAGGINTYAYADNAPTMYADPLGLKSFQCTKPLHALTDKFGANTAKWASKYVPAAYHQYSCVVDKKGKITCGGQDHEGSPVRGPGKPSEDTKDGGQCKEKPDNDCFEKCLIDEWRKPRPTYGIPFGTDCQEYDDNVHETCEKQCKGKK